MKKKNIVFGLASGAILAVFMIISTALCYNSTDFESSMAIGYASMLLAFSLIFVRLKKLRDSSGGYISFGKAFKAGLAVALIASTIYVLVWLFEYYLFMPDFIEKYTAHVLKEAREAGDSQSALQAKTEQMESMKTMYKNPLLVILITYSEVLPLGIIISLIAAFILKRRPKEFAGAS